MNSDDRKPFDEEIDVYGMTHVGKVRTQNEDQFLLCSLHKQMRVHATSIPDLDSQLLSGERLAFLALVADGLGGHAAGDVASRVALETVTHYITHSVDCYFAHDAQQEDVFLEQLRSSVLQCHSKILSKAAADPARRKMATTLTMLISIWPRAYAIQIGDSRCYRLRGGELIQITRDQTFAQDMIDEGMSEADTANLRHVLTSAIGGSEMKPVITKIDVRWDDVFMMCTDGLSGMVSEDKIRERLLNLETAELACKALVSDALEQGGEDNITVLIGGPRRAREG